jgi:hypothetical protein
VEGSSIHSNVQQYTELCWYIDTVYIVFTFLSAVFYNYHHHLDFLKGEEFLEHWSRHNGVREESSVWRLFVGYVFKLFV